MKWFVVFVIALALKWHSYSEPTAVELVNLNTNNVSALVSAGMTESQALAVIDYTHNVAPFAHKKQVMALLPRDVYTKIEDSIGIGADNNPVVKVVKP